MKDFKTVHYVSLLVVFFVAILLGYLMGSKNPALFSNKQGSGSSTQDDSILTTESGLIQGKVTKISGNTLFITNNKGVSGKFNTAEKMLIMNFGGQNGTVASPSSDLKTIELNKDAIINLQKEKGEYKVVSVSYQRNLALPSLAPKKLPTIATSSSTSK